MRSTVVGPYPRVGSECADKLRRELNRLYEGTGDAKLVQSLREELTREVIQEMVSAGIQLPNCGLVDVHDELTWPLEHVHGVEFGGMKKVFHTNTHYREALVNGKVVRKKPFLSELYKTALEAYSEIKIEFPGPYTMAKHSVLTERSPYENLRDLSLAYAGLYREELSELRNVPLIQFNEPSIVTPTIDTEEMQAVKELYAKMLDGLDVPVAVWTFYGQYSAETMSTLMSLPVGVIGFDFVWDSNLDELLRERAYKKKIGIGLIDSGDRGYIRLEDPDKIVQRLLKLKGQVDLDEAYFSSNATLEHLPRDWAKKKIALIGEVTRRVNK